MKRDIFTFGFPLTSPKRQRQHKALFSKRSYNWLQKRENRGSDTKSKVAFYDPNWTWNSSRGAEWHLCLCSWTSRAPIEFSPFKIQLFSVSSSLSLLLPNHEMNAFNLGFETSVIEKPDCYGSTRSFNVFFPIRKKATLTGERLLVFVFVMSLITLLLFAWNCTCLLALPNNFV